MVSQIRDDTATLRTLHPWGSTTPSRWALDASQSTFEFRVKHFWGLMTVSGHFTRFEGQAEVGGSGSVSASVRIDATSLDTKQKQRDKHLRSADFFDVEKHPNVTFTTRQVTALGADRVRVEGDLTVAGRAQPLAFEARLTAADDRITIDAEVSVDRTAFGMTWSPLRMASSTALLVVRAQFNRR
jgi:polyisoprenoid-binding protein YceI